MAAGKRKLCYVYVKVVPSGEIFHLLRQLDIVGDAIVIKGTVSVDLPEAQEQSA